METTFSSRSQRISEEDLVFLLSLGWTDRRIANEFKASERTVRRRIDDLYDKYEITSSRACLVFHVFNRKKSLRKEWLLCANIKPTRLLAVDDFTLCVWDILSQGVIIEAVAEQVEGSERTVRRRLLEVAKRIKFTNSVTCHMAAYSSYLNAMKPQER